MRKINENVALAKAILNKKGITTQSEEYSDYLKIRELCGNNHGYVGILTRLRFEDNIEDWSEIVSIYDILKNSKIDVGKINKMGYDDILNLFYDEVKTSNKNDDYEVIFKDSEYTYYRVYTYKGIMKTGSPAWCLKTKSNWDKYQEVYPEQYVIVKNEYKNRLPVPEDDILANYSSRKGYVRYGISVRINSDDTISWTGNDDNNGKIQFKPESYTFYGVFCTLLNILRGSKKSYYDEFRGCEKIDGTKNWHKMVRFEDAFDRLEMPKDYVENDGITEVYVCLSESYSLFPVLLIFDNYVPRVIYPLKDKREVKYSTLSGVVSKKLFEDYAKKSESYLYLGTKLKLQLTTLDDIKKHPKFIEKVDNWLIFDHNKNYYMCVNTNPDEYHIPTRTLSQEQFDIEEEPVYYYLYKSDLKPVAWLGKIPIREHHKNVINYLNNNKVEDINPVKKVKSFWNYFSK
jgi:hypothetical protein